MPVQAGPAAGKKGPERPRAVPVSAVWDDGAQVWRDGEYWYDEKAANAAASFFPTHLRLTAGEWAGKPFHLEGWQEHDIIRPAFGWKNAAGARRYRRVFVWVPRKNGKTELAAGVALLLLLGDGEYSGEVYAIATDDKQARISFNKATQMVGRSPTLDGQLQTLKTSVYYPPLNAAFQPMSGRPKGKHGYSASGIIGDEVHEWSGGDLYQFLHDSQDARRQPMEFLISTAGKKGTFGESLWDECVAIRDGLMDDPTTLVVIYAADAEDDWTAEETWFKANPNLGVSKKLESMRANARRAQQLPRHVNAFLNYQLNIWTDQATLWLPLNGTDDDGNAYGWDQCKGLVDWRDLEARLAGLTCFGGVDLSAVTDLSALVWWFPVQPGLDFPVALPRFFKPAGLLTDHSRRDRLPYDRWAKEGVLTATPGNVVDYEFIRDQIYRDGERFKIAYAGAHKLEPHQGGIALDRWNATETAVKLQQEDLAVVLFGQGFASMNAPAKELERLVLCNGFHHGGHPILRQHAKVVAVDFNPAGDIKPVKNKSVQRIDGIVALCMAIGISLPGLPQPSVYEQRGVTLLG